MEGESMGECAWMWEQCRPRSPSFHDSPLLGLLGLCRTRRRCGVKLPWGGGEWGKGRGSGGFLSGKHICGDGAVCAWRGEVEVLR